MNQRAPRVRGLLAVFLTVLWPGIAHLVVGRWQHGVTVALLPAPVLGVSAARVVLFLARGITMALWPGTIALLLFAIAPFFADRLVALLDRARLSGLWHRQGSQWQRPVLATGWVALCLPRALPLVMVGNELLRWHRCLMTTLPSGRATASTASWSTTRARLVTPAMPRQGLSTTPFPRMAVPAEDSAHLPPARELVPPQPTDEPPATPTGPLMVVPTPVPTSVPHPLAVVLEDGCLVLWLVGTAALPGLWNL
ncbi:hypothetical protein NET03_01525 [Thermomicrobium sp. CFH 73360]|uniref:hypothetical protein n=1 Tax=Thermomicrobium sp. CFH 73360 TaxID=2951987 RepID=UPI0020768A46|nr:hypothetical protein [Thermomicrobium sp. CFH 73360]MCM8745204.1 hypothetical protein [Thermomicrobium sp. CFH 73360]